MPYLYTGTEVRTYTGYRDQGTDRPLVAAPGGTYAMTAVQGAGPLPVPPPDGRWRPAPVPRARKSAAQAKPAPATPAEGDKA